jgi:hypothetical protein
MKNGRLAPHKRERVKYRPSETLGTLGCGKPFAHGDAVEEFAAMGGSRHEDRGSVERHP